MNTQGCPKSSKEILDIYFLENRARLLEIASFLDRLERAKDSEEAKSDFRYKAFLSALKLLLTPDTNRTKTIQLHFSDLSTEPVESAAGLKAVGAWEGAVREGN